MHVWFSGYGEEQSDLVIRGYRFCWEKNKHSGLREWPYILENRLETTELWSKEVNFVVSEVHLNSNKYI